MGRPKLISKCHPDVPHYAKGFCKNCYMNEMISKLTNGAK